MHSTLKKYGIIFLLFLGFLTPVSFSQKQVKLHAESGFSAMDTIEFYSYHKGRRHLLKSLVFKDNKPIYLDQSMHPGLYLLSLKNSLVLAEFIYNPNEEISIELNKEDLNKGILSIRNSKENITYVDLQKINAVYDAYLDSLQQVKDLMDVNKADFYKKSYQLDSMYEKIAQEKNSRLTYLQFNDPSGYTSSVLVPFHLIPIRSEEERSFYQTPVSYILDHYFRYPTIDKKVFDHYVLENAIIRYLTVYSRGDEASIIHSIDFLLGKLKSDPEVYSFSVDFMIEKLNELDNKKYSMYVDWKASNGCKMEVFSWEGLLNANQDHVKDGNIVDDIVMNNIQSQPVSLSNTCKKADFTLLIFWNAECEEAKKILPDVWKVLKADKKINVFAVYLDDKKPDWENFVNTYGLKSWVHASELKPVSGSHLVARFLVSRLPMMYLLDKDRKKISSIVNAEALNFELKSRVK